MSGNRNLQESLFVLQEIRDIPPILDRRQWNALLNHGLEKPCSYIIRKNPSDSTIIEAINGITGKIDYSGTNTSTVIQSAIDALTSGGTIYLKELELPAVTYGNNILIIEDYQGERKAYSNLAKIRNLPRLTSDPDVTGWGSAEAGREWFNTTTKQGILWDGSLKRVFIPSAAGGGYGTLTITAGQESGSFTHGSGQIPQHVCVTPLTNLEGRNYWVSEKTSSTVTVKISSTDLSDHQFLIKVEI